MAQITSTLSVVSYNAKICKYDNQTNICANGYSLNNLGRCLSQSLGKWNSTGFEPVYPVCLIEYESFLDSVGKVEVVSGTIGSSILQDKDQSYSAVSGIFPAINNSMFIDTVASELQLPATLLGLGNVVSSSITRVEDVLQLSVSPGVSRSYNVHHAGKNVIHHVAGASSEYWVVDTYSDIPAPKRENGISKVYGIYGLSKPQGLSYIINSDTTESGVGVPYRAISGSFDLPMGGTLASGEAAENPVYVCSDDLCRPSVTTVTPGSGTLLNTPSTNIEFSVFDSVGGVDIGLLSVVVEGNLSVQPEGTLVVSSGVDTTGGLVSISGDANQYNILYTPTNDWGYGEKVTVTVSGQDMVPLSYGEEWSCFDPDVRNVFGEQYSFYVYDFLDMATSITAIPDSEAPYITNVSPGMFTRGNDASTSITFDVVDAVTGVDISSLDISVNGTNVVLLGVAQTSEVTLYAVLNGYHFVYSKVAGFGYGSNVNVSVSVSDSYVLSTNSAVISYFFSTVEDTTLLVSGFSPEANASYLAATKEIGVSVYDNSFGLSDAYYVVNGTAASGSREDILGHSYLSTTVSGVSTISGTSSSGTLLTNAGVSGVNIVGQSFTGGTVLSGCITSGTLLVLPVPFDEITPATIASGEVEFGSLVSGTLVGTLVSGVNWDGNYTNGYVYGVTISGAELVSTAVSGVTTSGVVGYELSYHPPNDFDYGTVVNVTVHATNRNSAARVVKDEVYQLYHGFRVLENKYETTHEQQVLVSARAVNTERLKNYLSDIYSFSTYKQPVSDIYASIVPKVVQDDVTAQIGVIAPTHSYGETISVEIYIEDKAGNSLGPYTFQYTIESG